MKQLKTQNIHNTALLFILIAPFAIIYYAVYVFNFQNAGNIILYAVQVFADIIAITVVGTLWITLLLDIILPEHHKRNLVHNKKWLEDNHTIDILIPTANEPYDIVIKTVKAAIQLDHPHEVYILDDGNSKQIKKLASDLGIHYVSRSKERRLHAKAGNLNYGLEQCKGEFFAVFDADHIPKKTFITELLPFFENTKVALVQTPQHFVNTDNYIASGTAQAQEVFYKFIQPAKNSYNATFCVGTNMIYRRSAIDTIGGIARRDHSEDIWTTILLHEKGFETIFYNKVLAEGRAPESIPSFFRQQNRWARGGFSLFFTHNPLFITQLSLDQRLQYFFSNIHYFSGFAILIYIVLPIIYLLFGIHPMDIDHNSGWIYHYIPYFATVYFLPLFLLGNLKMSTISTSLASFAPYIQAFLSVAMKNNYKWIATESKVTSLNLIFFQLWPHVFLIALSLLAIIVGWYNTRDYTTTLITSFWVFINAYFLFSFVKNGIINSL